MINGKEYKITATEDWVTPEETLLDSNSKHTDLEQPISPNVFNFLAIGSFLLFGIIYAFTAKISLVDHDSLSAMAFRNRSVNFSIPAPRGIIYDSSGVALVSNEPSFDLLVVSNEAKKAVDDADFMSKLSDILRIEIQNLNQALNDSIKSNSVFFVSKGLSKEQVLAIKFLNPAGFYIITNTKRVYLSGAQFSSILGYAGKVNKDELSGPYYQPTDLIGRAGLESEYEKYLRGEQGRVFFSKDGENNQQDPVIGSSVVLNIDHAAQKQLYNTLYGVLRASNLDKGAAIVQKPSTGEVIAMASFPSYDNNLFVEGLSASDYKKLFENKSRPLFNRVISGLYNPGSTIKPMIGLMTLQEKIFEPTDNIRDCVELSVPNPFDPSSPTIFKNWRHDTGLFNLRRAIADSCNVYFYIAGGGFKDIKGLGIERISNYLKKSFADTILGIDLPAEEKGLVPTPDWKEKNRGESWYLGDTYNTSIGQGDLLVTPLWINTYVSAIANGGTAYKPRIANRIIDTAGNVIEIKHPEPLGKLPFSDDVINEIKSDMEETVLSGTAKSLRDLPVSVGSKTGTAEVIKGQRVNALFTAFAPATDAEIAITVLVEGSTSNEGYATRTAHEFMRWYFSR
ncbi:MAG: Peptidoglycan glycosyltransferase [Candidatus Yanofskybacteria bacterium GW2011_GWA1_44_21]|uniref:Penicillin-binding protein 2 n=2 Tax=Parcubacteria group TaxID=1794811 RepID=A0A1F8H228_9BACT|nr:MAG: Peptidoglycan glycosyltransferase [Candidatus Wolfebacteria bacterium GW2011_GWB1_41_12]KKT28892.1 MAG: Peptidoglycan glycosyltransferase [Candidatus Yanofskybacteria bacterium GW2011_GWA2_44_10]KKT50804.1 MAG: Peptidoglycan glycosyltransferase [Candidatus Yanofskybacteria bacterium GW2011_GWA1_44_21]OGN02909.1 MAG: hypothetical protein A2657_02835 [Candidatus Yanofskybacteria bacterium RIFCSPHIGHO2_01_FULL_44_110b]OGN14122.1 MAG: hypothetical protein A3C01_00815 [Candidatus Yanofskybac